MTDKSSITIGVPHGNFLVITNDQGQEMVRIGRDFALTYGDAYDPDEAARIFWDAFTRQAHEPRVAGEDGLAAHLRASEALVKIEDALDAAGCRCHRPHAEMLTAIRETTTAA